MLRESLNGMVAFVAVARAGSFTRAAAQLGVSQPALSQTVRGLEARLGIRLLARTTRSVSPTEAGERLLDAVGPRFSEIEAGLASLAELRDSPAGTVRIAADEHAAKTVLWPVLARLLPDYPDIKVEVGVEPGPTDLVAERFDGSVRRGGPVAGDMTSIRIGPDLRMAAVAAPGYFRERTTPERPEDLTDHACINRRLPKRGGIQAWEFARDGRDVRVWVDGPLVLDAPRLILAAALAGFGIAYLAEDEVQAHLDGGGLVRVLTDWCPALPGYRLDHPSRRRPSAAFAILIEALRCDADRDPCPPGGPRANRR